MIHSIICITKSGFLGKAAILLILSQDLKTDEIKQRKKTYFPLEFIGEIHRKIPVFPLNYPVPLIDLCSLAVVQI